MATARLLEITPTFVFAKRIREDSDSDDEIEDPDRAVKRPRSRSPSPSRLHRVIQPRRAITPGIFYDPDVPGPYVSPSASRRASPAIIIEETPPPSDLSRAATPSAEADHAAAKHTFDLLQRAATIQPRALLDDVDDLYREIRELRHERDRLKEDNDLLRSNYKMATEYIKSKRNLITNMQNTANPGTDRMQLRVRHDKPNYRK